MPKQNVAVGGFAVAAVLFLIAGAIPALKGDGLNTTFVVLAIAFALIAFAMHKKSRGNTPPAV